MRGFVRIALKAALWIGGILLVIGGILRIWFMDVVVVGHNGMSPTVVAGDHVLMWRGASDAEMGDIVVCRHPSDPNQMVMGRVVGTGGMTIRDVRGQLEINGTRPDYDMEGGRTYSFVNSDNDNRTERYTRAIEKLGNTEHHIWTREDFTFRLRESRVGPARYYLLGDNRSDPGHDSRSFGDVPKANCIGTLFMRWKPSESGAGDIVDNGWLDILD